MSKRRALFVVADLVAAVALVWLYLATRNIVLILALLAVVMLLAWVLQRLFREK
jgi:hypothetical protein